MLDVQKEVTKHIIPSFPVFSADLHKMKYTRPTSDTTLNDGFIRNESSLLAKKYPTLIVVDSGYENSFFVDKNELEQSVRMEGTNLFMEQVYVVWQWTWADEMYEEIQSPSPEDKSERSSNISTVSDSIESEDVDGTHCVVFKCIGVTKDSAAQTMLERVDES